MEVVLAAALAAVPATLAAAAAWRSSAHANSVLTGNGRGNVAEMVEHLVEWSETHDQRHLLQDERMWRLEQRRAQ